MQNALSAQKTACHDDAVFPAVEATGRRTVVLAGLQTDVCVAQSAVGLRRKGYDVVCIVDAVGSVHAVAHEAGLERMRSAGVVILLLGSSMPSGLGRSPIASNTARHTPIQCPVSNGGSVARITWP